MPEFSLKELVALGVAEAGIGPEPLAVAGLSGPQATSVIAQAVTAAEARADELQATQTKLFQARAALAALRGESGTSQETQAARERLENAESARDFQIDSIKAAALAQLTTEQMRRFHNCHSNTHIALPAWYGAAAWDPEEAVALAQAYRLVRDASADPDRTAPPDAQARVDSAEAHPDVAAASADYQVRLAAIQTTWKHAIDAVEDR